MPEETPSPAATETTPNPPEQIRRGKIGLNVGIQIVLGLVLFVMVNVIAHRRWKQWDFTYERNFTLSETTVKFLEQVKDPVRITVLTPRDREVEQDMQPLLGQYARYLGSKLKAEFIDTRRDAEAWENFRTSQRSGMVMPQNEEGVLVQAVNPQKLAGGEEKYHYKWIRQEALYLWEQEKAIPLAFRGESLLNAALAEVTQPDRPRVGLAAGVGHVRSMPNPEGGHPRTYAHVLAEVAAAQNIDLEPWRILQEPEMAGNYRCLVLAATTIFSGQQQADLTKYFETPGNSLLVLLDPEHESVEVNAWLKKYGVEVRADRVLHARSTPAGPIKYFTVDAQFQPDHMLTRGLEHRTTLLPGQTRSLNLLNNLEKVRDENIVLTSLLMPGADFWAEKEFKEDLPMFDRGEDVAQPLCVAAAVERGASRDARLQAQSSRMVVVGNMDLALPPTSQMNFDFLSRSLNWLLHREEAAPNDTSTDKAKHRFSISIKPAQWQRVLLICAVVLPVTALMAGLLIWSTRRN